VGIVERLVPDELWELWELFQRVEPQVPIRPQGGGRRRHGDGEVLAAIVFVATSGCTWLQLPSASFGPSEATAHRRFTEWSKARVWAKLHRLVLDELGARGELDWSRCAIDSVNMRALKRGGLTGPNPVNRGTYGSKVPLITDRTGLPLSVGISGANVHDSQALIPLVQGIPPIRSRRGRRRRKPGKLHGDKGYDYNHLRRWLRDRRITPRIARKGTDSSQRLGGTAGPSNTLWPGSPDADVSTDASYAPKASHFPAFTSIACTLICYRRLTK
jgi:transposase